MRKEENRNIPERFRLSFSSPYLSFPIYRFQKINLIRVRTPRARRISFTFHRCGLSTTLLPPPFVVACVAARTQEDGASSSLVDDCSPWISSLWRIYPKERGGGRELESLGDTSSSNRNPTVYYPLGYDQFRPAQLFHPLVIFFFLSVLLLFSSSFRRVLRATFEFTSVLPRCLVTERVGGSYPPHRRRVGSLLSKRRPG